MFKQSHYYFNFYSLNRLDPFVKGLVTRFILAHLLAHHDVGGPVSFDHVLDIVSTKSVRSVQSRKSWDLPILNRFHLFSLIFDHLGFWGSNSSVARRSTLLGIPAHLEVWCPLIIFKVLLICFFNSHLRIIRRRLSCFSLDKVLWYFLYSKFEVVAFKVVPEFVILTLILSG
jgi:hypothetical protein